LLGCVQASVGVQACAGLCVCEVVCVCAGVCLCLRQAALLKDSVERKAELSKLDRERAQLASTLDYYWTVE
jgi:hypothetical protein